MVTKKINIPISQCSIICSEFHFLSLSVGLVQISQILITLTSVLTGDYKFIVINPVPVNL
jgi:hypothetical protein